MKLNILRFVNSNMSILVLGIPLCLSQEFEMIHQDLLRLNFSFLSAIQHFAQIPGLIFSTVFLKFNSDESLLNLLKKLWSPQQILKVNFFLFPFVRILTHQSFIISKIIIVPMLIKFRSQLRSQYLTIHFHCFPINHSESFSNCDVTK